MRAGDCGELAVQVLAQASLSARPAIKNRLITLRDHHPALSAFPWRCSSWGYDYPAPFRLLALKGTDRQPGWLACQSERAWLACVRSFALKIALRVPARRYEMVRSTATEGEVKKKKTRILIWESTLPTGQANPGYTRP